MAEELRATTVNLKDLDQEIVDPVVVGAGDAGGRTLRVIFTQKAAAQFTPNTKVYLSWHHQEMDIKGYNVFTEITQEDDEDFPPTWEIKFPKSMLYEGNVLACIQIVDDVSIATSVNFMIHVLADPNDGSRFTATDDFTEFQQFVIDVSTIAGRVEDLIKEQQDGLDEIQNEFEDMKQDYADIQTDYEGIQIEFMDVREVADDARTISEQAKEISESALGVSEEALNTINTLVDVADEAKTAAQEAKDEVATVTQDFIALEEMVEENAAEVSSKVEQLTELVQETDEKIENAKHDMQDYADSAIEDALTIHVF